MSLGRLYLIRCNADYTKCGYTKPISTGQLRQSGKSCWLYEGDPEGLDHLKIILSIHTSGRSQTC